MKTTHIQITATDNVVLPALLFEPEFNGGCDEISESNRNCDAVILLHGNGHASPFYSWEKTNTYANGITKSGRAFVALNNRGAHYMHKLKKLIQDDTGKQSSAGAHREEDTMGGTAYELIADCIHDIDGIIDELRTRGYTRFYLMGESTGANKICVYNFYKESSTRENPCSGYVLVNGGDDSGIYYTMLGEERFWRVLREAQRQVKTGNGLGLAPPDDIGYMLSWQSIADMFSPDGDYNTFPYVDYFEKRNLATKELFREFSSISIPNLVIYGEHDEYTYGRVPEIMPLLKDKGNTNTQCITIPDGDHRLSGKRMETIHHVVQFLDSLER